MCVRECVCVCVMSPCACARMYVLCVSTVSIGHIAKVVNVCVGLEPRAPGGRGAADRGSACVGWRMQRSGSTSSTRRRWGQASLRGSVNVVVEYEGANAAAITAVSTGEPSLAVEPEPAHYGLVQLMKLPSLSTMVYAAKTFLVNACITTTTAANRHRQ